jgi:CCR4-NOT transcription complex subunit 3
MSPVAFTNSSQNATPSVPVFPLQKDKAIAINGSPKSITSPPVATVTPNSSSQTNTQEQESNESASLLSEPSAMNGEPSNGDPAPSQTSFETNGTDTSDIASLPPGLQDLLHSFQSARSRAEASSISSAPVSTTGKMLESSKANAPDAFDSESKKKYAPQTPYETPEYYPQLPHAVVTDPAFVRRCDVDTLFFMFYYQQETNQQYVSR